MDELWPELKRAKIHGYVQRPVGCFSAYLMPRIKYKVCVHVVYPDVIIVCATRQDSKIGQVNEVYLLENFVCSCIENVCSRKIGI